MDKGTNSPVSEVGVSEGGSEMEEGKRCSSRDYTRIIRVAFGEDWGSTSTGGKGY